MRWVTSIRAVACTAIAVSAAAAAETPAVRLPQDAPRERDPVKPPDLDLVIDSDRFAEQAPQGAADVTLRLSGIELSGNHALPLSRFTPLWAGLIGKDIPLSTVFDVAARISAIYRQEGYVLSQAFVPRQQISQADGRVRLQVAEGYISRISLAAGLPGRDRIEAMLHPVLDERPLTLATLERHLLLLNDLPGVKAQASLRRASEENAAEMVLTVTRDLTAYSLSAHNRTTAAVGPMRLEASAERRALLGDFDRHVLRWVGSGNHRLDLLAYSGDAPMGFDGAQLLWSASAARSRPKSGERFQLDTRSENLSIGASHPLLRSRAANLGVQAHLAGYNGSSDIADGLLVATERLRTLRLGLSADLADRLGGLNLLDLEYARGLSTLGASKKDDPALTTGRDPQFNKLTAYIARLQSLGGELNVLLAASVQTSRDLLPSSEQFSLGGDVFLRAYDASELLGDTGMAGKVELRYNLRLGTQAGTVYAYYDEGRVRLRSFDGTQTREGASAIGLGLRITAPGGWRGFVEVAKPRNKVTARNGDEKARGFAGLGLDF